MMRIGRFVLLNILFLTILIPAAAQQPLPKESETEQKEAREKLEQDALKLLEQAIGEITSLRLWENRALALAMAGDLLWKTDQKRARQLFRNAADELVRGAYQPKTGDEESRYWEQRSPRRVVLLLIAEHDADLALNLLKETRSPELQAAVDARRQPAVSGGKKTPAEIRRREIDAYRAGDELGLEQSFAAKAAEQDPERAAAMIRESLEKGVSVPALQMVQKVSKKDAELGTELLGEVIEKLLSTTFTEDYQSGIGVAHYLLDQALRPESFKRMPDYEPIKLAEKDLRAIAGRVADYFIKAEGYRAFWSFSRILPALEKYVPEKIAALRQKEKQMSRLMPASMRASQDALKMVSDPNVSAEKLIAEARNQNQWQKLEFYRRAIDKLIEKGAGERARQLLRAEPAGRQRDEALDYLGTRLTGRALKSGRLEQAQELIDQTETKPARIRMLVDLAVGFQKKNTEESRKTAVRLMDEAARLVKQFPESREEAANILKVAAGFAVVDPPRAFPYLQNLIRMANDLLTARALLAKYSKRSDTFKDGEIIFTQNAGHSIAGYGSQLGSLAAADFDRTVNLIGDFQRADVRTLAKLLLVRSVLKKKIGLEGNRVYGYG